MAYCLPDNKLLQVGIRLDAELREPETQLTPRWYT
jgi:hypothetical protein